MRINSSWSTRATHRRAKSRSTDFRAGLAGSFLDTLPGRAGNCGADRSFGSQIWRVRVEPSPMGSSCVAQVSRFSSDGKNSLLDSLLEADANDAEDVAERRSVIVILPAKSDEGSNGTMTPGSGCSVYDGFVRISSREAAAAHAVVVGSVNGASRPRSPKHHADTGGFYESM